MAKNINKQVFTQETLQKLDIFAKCFQEWFPVFIHNPYSTEIYICDFFAGSGTDAEGALGSPLLLLEQAKGADCRYCNKIRQNNKKVHFIFNEKLKSKEKELENNFTDYLSKCRSDNCKEQNCVYAYNSFTRFEFKDIFQRENFSNILSSSDIGKFVLLDQYGYKEVDENIFLKLINSPKTDFIFFISSSYISRFKEHSATKNYFNTDKIDFTENDFKQCHRLIADYYQKLIPNNKEYYLHHFTIRKGSNYQGLIFGTSHTLGMEKFLKVCWAVDKNAGESNCNIDNDYDENYLFHDVEESKKIKTVKLDIRTKIFSGDITDNRSGLKYALKNRCLPNLFNEVVKELEKNKYIERIGELNYSATDIHKVKEYKIKLIQVVSQ